SPGVGPNSCAVGWLSRTVSTGSPQPPPTPSSHQWRMAEISQPNPPPFRGALSPQWRRRPTKSIRLNPPPERAVRWKVVMNMSEQIEPAALRPGEVAKRLSVGRTKVYDLMNTGELPFVQLGPRCRRIPVDALTAWLARQTH